MKLHDPYGHRAFTRSLTPSTSGPENTHYGIIFRACQSCIRTHMKIFYRRKTPVPDGFNLIDNILYREDDGGGFNVWGDDFSLHSTFDDALKNENLWKCPNDVYNYGTTFYGRCSPDGTQVNNQRSQFHKFD